MSSFGEAKRAASLFETEREGGGEDGWRNMRARVVVHPSPPVAMSHLFRRCSWCLLRFGVCVFALDDRRYHDAARRSDVQKLLPAGLLPDDGELLAGVMRTYNVQQYQTAAVPGSDYKMIICKTGEVDKGHYLDPRSGKVFGFNHCTGVLDADDVEDADNWPVEPELEETRSKLGR